MAFDAKCLRDLHPILSVRSGDLASAAHIEDEQAASQPAVLTVGRESAAAGRRASLAGTPSQSGLDRDEYPPAMFREGGKGASVRLISPSDNRGAGACIGAQCRNLPEGSRVRITVVPDE